MAKQKSFHSKLVAKVKRDARYCWNARNVNEIRAFFERMRPREPLPTEDELLLGEGFLCLQQEAFIRSFYEDWIYARTHRICFERACLGGFRQLAEC